MIEGVELEMLLASAIENRESGRIVLQSLLASASCYTPERYNNYEPISHIFDPDDLETTLDLWEDPFLWRRRRPRQIGGAHFGNPGIHDFIKISLALRAFDRSATINLFEDIDLKFGIDLAFVHVRTSADIEDIEHYRAHLMPFQCLTTRDLREGLPGLSWAMWFGEPYRELFGDRLLDVPAFAVREIGTGVYVQLTGKITDVDRKRDAYLAAQAAAQKHLNNDAFRGSSSGKCRVPEFRVPRP